MLEEDYKKLFKILIAISVIIGIFFSILITTNNSSYNKGQKDALEKCDYAYLISENDDLKNELNKWYDHVYRMKVICGVPDSVDWNYKNKIRYNIDLKALEKWKN